MTQTLTEVQLEPYQAYRAQITDIEEFAQQTQFCYRITQAYMQDGANGASEDPLVRTRAALFRNCLLLEWMYFEQFVNDLLQALFRKYPAKLVALGQQSSFSSEELGLASLEFTSIERLRDVVIARELQRQQIGEYPIIGLLNLLKRDFKVYNDPFTVEYVHKGQTRTITRQELIWLQDIATCVLQHAGVAPQHVLDRHPQLTVHDGRLVITEGDYQVGKTILNALAFAIAQSIENGWYDPR